MKYRRFGKTELMLPVVSCGCMRFQQSFQADEPVSEACQNNLEECIHRALELGINHFETARGYGTSEAQLGRILPQLERDAIIVQTKIFPEANVAKFEANFEDSMTRLNLDYLDIFSLHGINNEAMFNNAMRCLESALRWKKEGRIRHIGFASHGPTDILLKAIETDAFESMNLHWFYIQQEKWPAIAEAAKRDMGVYIISPNDKGGMLYAANQKLERLTAPLHPMVFNGLFCLAKPEIHSLSCGVAEPGDFDLHLKTVEKADQAASLAAPITARLDREMEEVLGTDWLNTWRVGLPQWQDTPGKINLPVILQLRNLVLALEMNEFAKMRYNLLGNGDHWFPGNKAGQTDKLDFTECLQHSPHAAQIPAALEEIHALLAGEEVKRLQQ